MKISGFKICALIIAVFLAVCSAAAESDAPENEASEANTGEEQGLSEIQPLIIISEVTETEGMSLEEVTEAAAGTSMSEYADSSTGFIMQYPAVFQFDEEQDILIAYTEDRKASLLIENMPNEGGLTEKTLMEALRQIPDTEPQKNEQNGCIRIDRIAEDGVSYQTDLYYLTDKSFHHIMLIYPPEEQETYHAYIEYMINSMGTSSTDQG